MDMTRISTGSAQGDGSGGLAEAARTPDALVRVHWVTGAAVVALIAVTAVESPPLRPAAAAVLCAVVVAELLLHFGLRHGRRSPLLWLCQLAVDIAAVTAVCLLWPNLRATAAILYGLPVVFAGLSLERSDAALVAGLCVSLLAAAASLGPQVTAVATEQTLGLAIFLCGAVVVSSAFKAHAARTQRARAASLEALAEGVAFVDADGNVLFRNRAFADSFPGVPGQTGLLPWELRQYVHAALEGRAGFDMKSFSRPGTSRFRQDRQHFEAHVSASESGCLVVVEDVTYPRKLEEDLDVCASEIGKMADSLEKHQIQIAQHEKMVALGTMAAGIAHEISNPLACLSAVAQLLIREAPSPRVREQLDCLTVQTERIAKTVRQILDFSRPSPKQMELVDLEELVEQVIRMVRYSHRSAATTITSSFEPEHLRVRLVPQEFQQVLVNVLLNAMDALGEVSRPGTIHIACTAGEGTARVVVADNGPGMKEPQLRHAFEPFFTTKPPGKGTGLGLAISYRLVERRGGTISIDSTWGKGTVVTISFPADPSDDTTVVAPTAENKPGIASAETDYATDNSGSR